MDSALIISYFGKSAAYLSEVLAEARLSDIATVYGAGEARRRLSEKCFDLCIINSPLPDEFGDRLACHIAARDMSDVILIVRAELYDEISVKTVDHGVITLAKPISKPLLRNALSISEVAHKRIQTIRSENQRLKQKLEEIKIIDRAKCILISTLAVSEPEAHRYIEKQAMDLRITRREVAEEILKTYEN